MVELLVKEAYAWMCMSVSGHAYGCAPMLSALLLLLLLLLLLWTTRYVYRMS